LMAILAIEVDESVRSSKVVLQMHGVVELYGGRIAVRQTQGRKFRMIPVEAGNALRKVERTASRVQIGVALDAIEIARGGQAQAALMFLVARRTIWSESLRGVVNGAVVAGFAPLVARFGAEMSGFLDVARVALGGKDGVC
jgi:hypothetical protein